MGGALPYHHPAHHHQYQMENGFEEPQTPTSPDMPGYPLPPGGPYPGAEQPPGPQMSYEDALDGGHNSGSYNAGQQQRRIIREIIV